MPAWPALNHNNPSIYGNISCDYDYQPLLDSTASALHGGGPFQLGLLHYLEELLPEVAKLARRKKGLSPRSTGECPELDLDLVE